MSALEYLIDFAEQRQSELPMMDNTIGNARAELASLRSALAAAQPFAGKTVWLDKAGMSDNAELCVMHNAVPYSFGLTLGDLRRLAAALAALPAVRKE